MRLISFLLIICSWKASAAGGELSFQFSAPAAFLADGKTLPAGKYSAVVSNWDSCNVDLHGVGERKTLSSVASFAAGCFLGTDLEPYYKIDVFGQDRTSRALIVVFETPDHGVHQTRIIVLRLRKAK